MFSEGLWGFPEGARGIKRSKWVHIDVGDPVLIFGEFGGKRGVWFLGEIIERFEERGPVKYWIQNPTGYPLQIRIRFKSPSEKLSLEILDSVRYIGREELSSIFGINIFKAWSDRWSLIIFRDVKERGITYQFESFKTLRDEFLARNKVVRIEGKPDHDKVKELIYQIGVIQNRNPDMEYPIDGKRLDVVWRRTSKSVPSVAFKVQFGGNIFEALTKLKHAFDIWNSIPVLITTESQIDGAKQWLEGSFHELKDIFIIIEWTEITKYYTLEQKIKNLEIELGIS